MAATTTIRFKTSFKNTILDALSSRPGWVQVPEGSREFDFWWADKTEVREVLPQRPLREGQRLNHFPNFWELCRKDNLAKNLKRMRRALGREEAEERLAFVPLSFNLPSEYPLFVEEFKRQQQRASAAATAVATATTSTTPNGTQSVWWIAKPSAKSQGKGIFLFSTLSQVADWRSRETAAEPVVVQKYIASPYLVGGRKFDMRIYVLVTQYSPGIVAYLHRSGFARLTFQRYSTSRESMANSFVHLTNVAVQKHSESYDSTCGAKWDMRALRLHILRLHGKEATDKAFLAVQQALITTLLAVQPVMQHDRRCFELYGFDVLFDSELQPFVLEVNASPSMTAETPRDHLLKTVVINDTIDVADVEGRRDPPGSVVDSLGGFDLIYNCGWSRPTCNLGFYCPRLHGPPRATPTATKETAAAHDEEE